MNINNKTTKIATAIAISAALIFPAIAFVSGLDDASDAQAQEQQK